MKHANYSCHREIGGRNAPLAPPNAFSRKGHFKGLRAEALEENPQSVAMIAAQKAARHRLLEARPARCCSQQTPLQHAAPRSLPSSSPGAHPRHTGRPGRDSHVREPAAQSSHVAPWDSVAAPAAARPRSPLARCGSPPLLVALPSFPGRRANPPLLPHPSPGRLGPARGGHTIQSRAPHRGFADSAVGLHLWSRAQLTSLGSRRRPDPNASFPTRPSWRLSAPPGLEPTRLGARAGRRET